MSLSILGNRTKPTKTIFEIMGLVKTSMTIRRTRNRRLVESGSFSVPIIDNHLIVYDEKGNPIAICHRDLKRILDEIDSRLL